MGARPVRITRQVLAEQTTSPASKRLAKELKARGFRFVGPTTAEPDLDEAPLVEALEAAGLRVRVSAWRDPEVDWSASRLTLIRSTWPSPGSSTDWVGASELLHEGRHRQQTRMKRGSSGKVVPLRWFPYGAISGAGQPNLTGLAARAPFVKLDAGICQSCELWETVATNGEHDPMRSPRKIIPCIRSDVVFKGKSGRFQKGVVGVLALGLVAFNMYEGEVSAGRYSSSTYDVSDPAFWFDIVALSGVGFYLLFSALFDWNFFGDEDGPDEGADLFGRKSSTPEPDTAAGGGQPDEEPNLFGPPPTTPEPDTSAGDDQRDEEPEVHW